MASYIESTGRASVAEPVGLLTESAVGIAVIALAIIALAGVSVDVMASIATIVIGVGLIVQGFNSGAEEAKLTQPASANAPDATLGGEAMVHCAGGLTGIVLGILALVGVNTAHLLAPALIVFGSSLLLGGFISMRPRTMRVASGAMEQQMVTYQTSPAISGLEALAGLAAIILGILSVIMTPFGVPVLVGFLAVGAALLVVSASFAGAALRLFGTA